MSANVDSIILLLKQPDFEAQFSFNDILVLTTHFINQLRPDDSPELDDAVCQYFLMREYPGNVRDLKQLVPNVATVDQSGLVSMAAAGSVQITATFASIKSNPCAVAGT